MRLPAPRAASCLPASLAGTATINGVSAYKWLGQIAHAGDLEYFSTANTAQNPVAFLDHTVGFETYFQSFTAVTTVSRGSPFPAPALRPAQHVRRAPPGMFVRAACALCVQWPANQFTPPSSCGQA